jgi:ribosomal protein L17
MTIMNHNNKIHHLGRTHSHRELMLSNMAVSPITHKRIFTTLAKAKELRKYIEPLITKSKDDTTHSRRIVFSNLRDKYAVTELFQEVSQKIGDRPGGYTRIIKIGNRLGDNAEMCFIELVDYNELMLKNKKPAKKTRRSRRIGSNNSDKQDNQQGAYLYAQMVRVIGFRDIFPEQKVPTIESLIVSVPREKLIAISQVLINLYKNATIKEMQKFFSPQNTQLKENFNKRFEKFNNSSPSYLCMFCVIQTATELLRQAFAIPYRKQDGLNENAEENLLKAILVINDKLMDFVSKSENKDSFEQIAELLIVNSFSQKDINNFDYNEVFREMITKSIDLFEYVSNDVYIKQIYIKFLEKLGLTHYREYCNTILGLFGIIYQQVKEKKEKEGYEQWAGSFRYDKNNDIDKIIDTNVLDYLSIPLHKNIPLKENEDYKIFRDKPLVKMPDGSYEIVNVGFLLERLFSSLYFDFKTIAKELNLSGFEDKYKQSFMEKMLLCKYLELINNNQKYFALGSKDIKAQYPQKGGEPDYYLRTDKTVFLFENKDIMINATVKESRNYDKIIAEYKNKLLFKTHSNNKLLPENKQKPEGIGQLVEQIKKIQNGDAYWDETVAKDSIIYPVLVIDDSKLLPDGLTFLMQKWYDDRSKLENINTRTTRPLIVISLITLLLYSQEFKENGFDYYFEKYYRSIEEAKKQHSANPLIDIANIYVSFSEYMKQVHPKNFIDTFNLYKDKILPKRIN